MGNYGCDPHGAEKISVPLYTEASVNLIRRRPINSMVAHGKRVYNQCFSITAVEFLKTTRPSKNQTRRRSSFQKLNSTVVKVFKTQTQLINIAYRYKS